MAEKIDDPIEESTLRQKVGSNYDKDEDSILRILSRKSSRKGEEVKWTEEVKTVRPYDFTKTFEYDDRGNFTFGLV
jgi:hypothetical protein